MDKKRSTELPWEMEIKEIQVTKKEFERRQTNLIKALLEIEENFRINERKVTNLVA